MNYEYYYNNARNRYYDASAEITSCENRINDLRHQRQQKVNQINQLRTDIKNHQDALANITQISQSSQILHRKLLYINNKTSEASMNFSGMLSSSSEPSKNLDDVYGEEMSNTRHALNGILDSLNAKKNTLNSQIADLQSQLRQAEWDLQDIDNDARATQTRLQESKSRRSNASYDMEYYRRKMNAAV